MKCENLWQMPGVGEGGDALLWDKIKKKHREKRDANKRSQDAKDEAYIQRMLSLSRDLQIGGRKRNEQ